jgi:hypothetical protein
MRQSDPPLTAGAAAIAGALKDAAGGHGRIANRFQVSFDDQKSKRYTVNLTDPLSKDYVPPANWKRI